MMRVTSLCLIRAGLATIVATMTPAEAEKRIAHSRDVVSRYQAMGRPTGGDLSGMIAMFRDEIGIIEQIATDHPDLAGEVTEIVRRCQDYINRLKLGMN